MQNQTYQNFKTAIANKLIDEGIFDSKWFSTQEARLQMFWEHGESSDSAYYVIHSLAETKFAASNYSSPNMKSLMAVGCEFKRS